MANKRKQKRIKISLRTRTVAVVSIALPLLLLGWMAVLQVVQQGLQRQVHEEFTFTLLLEKDMAENRIDQLAGRLAKHPAVKEVVYISPDDAAQSIKEELKEDPVQVLGYNPFYPSLELKLHAAYANRDSLPKIDTFIQSLGGVDNFSYRSDLIDEVDAVLERLSLFLLVGVVLMLVIAFMQLSNTTHLLIYSRRFLIRSMTLLGAPFRLISRPIVRTTVYNGFLGGLLADVLVAFSLWLADKYLGDTLLAMLQWHHLAVIGIALPLLGIFLSLFTALAATRRYIRMDGSRIVLG